MGIDLSLGCHQSLRQELKQELRLSLHLRLAPPDGISFREPPPLKSIERLDGAPVIPISRSELASYISAVRKAREIFGEVEPSVVIISMRGALPFFRSIAQDRVERAIWANPSEVKSFDYPSHGFTGVKVYTSYFLDNLGEVVSKGLKRAVKQSINAEAGHRIVYVDTSVTGTKLGWFMPQFTEGVMDLASQMGESIQLVNILLHHGQPGRYDTKTGLADELVTVTTHNIGVESLITEDNATLLGASYAGKFRLHPDAVGEIQSMGRVVNAGLLIDAGLAVLHIKPELGETTADLFVRLVGNATRIA
ncbi:Uncharacterised protein [Candidatus Bilamarchaeum dharawalense]|uniref:Uncharacterized protein n=1 Tax=Candidatus Bilamarchaeum dharawalense TaxID=2885759 RepID=A0A5E4LQ73_9ARCH|nr:Uncharacterised protein [Candidatus Bilamarchaeum dharawalense]